jgi:glycosyltransferase involved in cell wall biosynthesis
MFESVKGLARTLDQLGARITILAGSDAYSDVDRATWSPLKVINCSSSGFQSGVIGKTIADELDRLQPDFVHLHGIWGVGSRALARWAPRSGTPYAVSPRGMLDAWALRRSNVKKRFSAAIWERKLLRNANFLHALTSNEAAAMRAFGHAGPIILLPNGVDVPKLTDDQLFSERKIMLFMARLHPKKGAEELIRGWSLLPEEIRHEWILVIAGRDEVGLLGHLRRMAAAFGLSKDVIFTGGLHGTEKRDFLRKASAFILPSYSEGLPMAVLEAWADALPVFMTTECNLDEGFEAGAAYKITTQPNNIAEVLAVALKDENSLKATGRAGRQLVETRYGWNTIAERLLEAYRFEIHEGKSSNFMARIRNDNVNILK